LDGFEDSSRDVELVEVDGYLKGHSGTIVSEYCVNCRYETYLAVDHQLVSMEQAIIRI